MRTPALCTALFTLALGACATPDGEAPEVVDASPSVAVGGDLRSAMTNVIPTGSPVRYHWEGLNPGDRMYLARAGAVAPGPCIAIAGGVCLDIGPGVSLVGSAPADASGEASVWFTVPDEFAGRDLVLQALVVRGAGGVESFKGAPQTWTTVDAMELGELVPGDLAITEVMRDPTAVSDAAGEWFEVRNMADRPITLNGLGIADADSDYFLLTGAITVLEPGEHLVFGTEPDPALNGGVVVERVTTDITLANGTDELMLLDGDRVLAEAVWDESLPNDPGHALQRDPVTGAWCNAQVAYGAGDFGTPGALNPACAE